ncbi:MAG: multicopper oxidase [Nitrospira sp.]
MGVAALGLTTLALAPWTSVQVFADPLPGGTLDPTTIPKYVTPLVIPPVMHRSETNGDPNRHMTDATKSDYMPEDEEGRTNENYQIAVRQFKQQILPGGIWNTLNGRSDAFPATTVWSYGPQGDPTPVTAPDPTSQFNYPAYTIETKANRRVNVRWINGLVDSSGRYLPHLLPVDQTLHWANPPGLCAPHNLVAVSGTDCMGIDPAPYAGPVPIVTHVHGSHVDPASDGYPEAWYLPAANNIPSSFARHGRLFDDATGHNPGNLGYANFSYRNDQAATTLWYHDHALGMTRSNVYAGPAGFWLIRGGKFDGGIDVIKKSRAILPGPAARRGQGVLALNTSNPVRNAIREIPIAIQDRSFNSDGSLFYPQNRAFFEGGDINFPFGIPLAPQSDVPPIWNPEAFFNVMVVNGVTWPQLEVAQDRYRFRLLNGCNSRTLNLALFVVDAGGNKLQEIPFYQIGAEQGFLPKVVRIKTGEHVALTAGAPEPASTPNTNDPMALLMTNAERADVIVDFSGLPNGTVVRMVNTGPDAPFNGLPIDPASDVADPGTTGQVMQFVVNTNPAVTGAKGSTDGRTTAPANLNLNEEQPLGPSTVTRLVSVNELSSKQVCVKVDANGNFVVDTGNLVPIVISNPTPTFESACLAAGGAPFGPTVGMVGTVDTTVPLVPLGNPLQWTDETGNSQPVPVKLNNGTKFMVNVTETPKLGDTEEWKIYNFTVDSHPMHLHLVRFQVVSRTNFDGSPSKHGVNPQPWETGYKDTVIAYPGEITTVKAKFEIPGLYVWHCHIVEHEDNEMMRPYVVSAVPPPPHHHDFDDRDREHHKMKHDYRWADKRR